MHVQTQTDCNFMHVQSQMVITTSSRKITEKHTNNKKKEELAQVAAYKHISSRRHSTRQVAEMLANASLVLRPDQDNNALLFYVALGLYT